MKTVTLDGNSLNFAQAEEIAKGAVVKIHPRCRKGVERARKFIERKISGGPVYSLNTGLGVLANKIIDGNDLLEFQRNIIRSHAGGSGSPLSIEETKLVLALRLNLLIKGYSGVRYAMCEALQKFLQAGISPIIPEYGSVGASGDLIPLAHVGLALMGEGEVWYAGKVMATRKALSQAKLKAFVFEAREGLACINGTEVMQAVGGLALSQALQLQCAAVKIAALSFEALLGNPCAFDARIHKVRGQVGQIEVAKEMRDELRGSTIFAKNFNFPRVQDPYSLRCIPQIHGPTREALNWVRERLEIELNAVTDNPLVFAEQGEILSGGNFHGQVLAFAFDMAALACTHLGGVSERRLELLSNSHVSGLTPFLSSKPGLESGYMVLQYLSASMVNESKVFSYPASADSIPGNMGIEDYVSMGMTAARKFKKVVKNLEVVLAAEILAAAQAVDLRGMRRLGSGTRKTYEALREMVPMLKKDRVVANDVAGACKVVQELGIHEK